MYQKNALKNHETVVLANSNEPKEGKHEKYNQLILPNLKDNLEQQRNYVHWIKLIEDIDTKNINEIPNAMDKIFVKFLVCLFLIHCTHDYHYYFHS